MRNLWHNLIAELSPLIVILMFSWCVPYDASAKIIKNVLILHSYHRGLGWTDSVARGIDDTLSKSDFQIETFTEYMDTKRIYNKRYLDELAVFLKDKYRNRKFDVVISSDDHAFQFLLDHHQSIFPATPVVFCGVNFYKDEFIRSEPDFTGVVESFDIKATIDAAVKINPQLQRVYSVVDNTMSGKANLKVLKQIIPLYIDKIQFEIISDRDMSEVRKEVGHLPPDSIVLILSFTSDKSGNTFSHERSCDLITEASNRPTYSCWDFHLNHGIVGGMLTTGVSQGAAAAKLALEILHGENPENIPVIKKSPNQYIFDDTVLKKFNLSASTLPPNSIVINRPYSFYEVNKKIVWSTLAAFSVLLCFIIALMVNISRRRRVERELVDHRDHLEILVDERTRDLTDSNKALKDSEMRFRSLSDASFEGILLTEKEKIIDANKALSEMFGYSKKELIEMNATDFVVPEMRKEILNKLLSDYEEPYEILGIKKDNSIIPVEAHIRMLSYQGRMIRVTAIRDLSERKKAEKLLMESERRLVEAQRIAKIGHYVLDVKSGCWTNSSELDEIFGISKDFRRDIRGWEQIIHPDHQNEMLRYLNDHVFGRGQKFDKEYKIINKSNGKEYWVHGRGDLKLDENNNVAEMIGTIQDITERRQMEQDLRDSQQNMASVLNNIEDAIVRLDKDFRFIFINPSVYRVTGLSAEQCLGMTNREIGLPEELCSLLQKKYENVFRNGKVEVSEFSFLTANKGERIFQAVISPEFNENSTVETIICIMRDITELKQTEAEKNATIAKLEKALAEVNTLRGLIPICARCKKIKDDKGYWNTLESYIESHSDASFSHGMCKECSDELYGNQKWYIEMKKKKGWVQK